MSAVARRAGSRRASPAGRPGGPPRRGAAQLGRQHRLLAPQLARHVVCAHTILSRSALLWRHHPALCERAARSCVMCAPAQGRAVQAVAGYSMRPTCSHDATMGSCVGVICPWFATALLPQADHYPNLWRTLDAVLCQGDTATYNSLRMSVRRCAHPRLTNVVH